MRGHRDLVIASATAVLCGVVVLCVPLEGVRLAAAVPLSLLLPGYAITAAAFGRRQLQRPQLLLLSVGMSLATLAIGGLVLNYVPGGLRAASWAGLLLLVVLGGCTIAALRRPRPANRDLPGLRPQVQPVDGTHVLGTALAGVAAVLAVGMALAISWTPVPAKNAVGYTRLWMLPSGGATRAPMRIGVDSEEQHPVAYKLEVQVGRRHTPFSSRLVLRPGQGRVLQLRVRRRPPGSVPVTALLFRRDHPNAVYRRVTGWIAGAQAPQ
jgi:uncharacterized membrane protein